MAHGLENDQTKLNKQSRKVKIDFLFIIKNILKYLVGIYHTFMIKVSIYNQTLFQMTLSPD